MKKSVSLKERECVIQATALEPAPYLQRLAAFLLDFVLIIVFTAFLLNIFILPEYFPGAQEIFREQFEEYLKLLQAAATQEELMQQITFDRIVQEAIGASAFWFLGLFSVYHAIGESFFQGSSFGKRVFSLQVLSVVTCEPLGFFEAFLRGALKAVTLMVYAPLLWINYALVFFGTKRQCGHDLLMRTVVVFAIELPEKDEDESFEDEE